MVSMVTTSHPVVHRDNPVLAGNSGSSPGNKSVDGRVALQTRSGAQLMGKRMAAFQRGRKGANGLSIQLVAVFTERIVDPTLRDDDLDVKSDRDDDRIDIAKVCHRSDQERSLAVWNRTDARDHLKLRRRCTLMMGRFSVQRRVRSRAPPRHPTADHRRSRDHEPKRHTDHKHIHRGVPASRRGWGCPARDRQPAASGRRTSA